MLTLLAVLRPVQVGHMAKCDCTVANFQFVMETKKSVFTLGPKVYVSKVNTEHIGHKTLDTWNHSNAITAPLLLGQFYPSLATVAV